MGSGTIGGSQLKSEIERTELAQMEQQMQLEIQRRQMATERA